MGINSDMDRYLRERKHRTAFRSNSWWDSVFAPKPKELPADELSVAERAKLRAMETEIKQGEKRIEQAPPSQEQELAQVQEERVTLYQQFRKLFQREHRLEEAYEHLEAESAPIPDTGVTDDFRKLAQIQMRWFERMPTRVRDEFKESEDYKTYVEILQRRGVVKKK